MSAKLEKERFKKATQQAAAAQHQTSANSSTVPPADQQQTVSESQLPKAVELDHKQPYSEKEVKESDDVKPNKNALGMAAAGTGSVVEEPVSKKGKPESGSHDSAEPMETESCDQTSERGQPMEAELTNQNAADRQVAETDSKGKLY